MAPVVALVLAAMLFGVFGLDALLRPERARQRQLREQEKYPSLIKANPFLRDRWKPMHHLSVRLSGLVGLLCAVVCFYYALRLVVGR